MSLTPDEFQSLRAVDCCINFELAPGSDITHVCEMALKAAANIGIPCRFKFNGVDCVAMPDTESGDADTFAELTQPDTLHMIEVELHSTEPTAVAATRRTVEGLSGDTVLSGGGEGGNGRYYLVSASGQTVKFAAWACERQGYVKRVLG